MRRLIVRGGLLAVALFALSGTALAANHYVITSSKQIKPGAISASRLSKAARKSLRGHSGPAGPAGTTGTTGSTGATGPVGPSHGYTTSFDANVALEQTGTTHTLMTIDVPAGSYVVMARLQGITVTDPDGIPGNSYRYDCHVAGGGSSVDAPTARVGELADVESYLTYDGGFTSDTPSQVMLVCSAGNGHPLTALSGSMTAIKVGSLN
jgi:hypothetical protein